MELKEDFSNLMVSGAKSRSLNIDNLGRYVLSLQIGIRYFQICITDSLDSSVKLLENYELKGVKSVTTRLESIYELYDNHQFLQVGFWSQIKISFKTHKNTLIPEKLFDKSLLKDYLKITSNLNPNTDILYFYKHKDAGMVNVFALDKKLVHWFKSVYPTQKPKFMTQSSSIIEGVLKAKKETNEKMMYCLFDQNIVHILVIKSKKLLFYNQFGVNSNEEYLRYIMLVFKEYSLSQQETNLVLLGSIHKQDAVYLLLKKYIRNIHFQSRLTNVKITLEFDEMPSYEYFDLLNIYSCE